MIETMQAWITSYGYLAIFLLMLISAACIPFPSEVTLLVGGWYSARGDLDIWWVILLAVGGSMIGSWIGYVIGLTTGRTLVERYGKYVLIRTHEMERAELWWADHGEAATFIGRLLPVIRSFISLPAGIARMNLARFTIYTLAGVAVWTVSLTWIGHAVGSNWEQVSGYMRIPTLLVLAALVTLAGRWYIKRRRVARQAP
jgi:membrane protein DedA with SNARE-associated domain